MRKLIRCIPLLTLLLPTGCGVHAESRPSAVRRAPSPGPPPRAARHFDPLQLSDAIYSYLRVMRKAAVAFGDATGPLLKSRGHVPWSDVEKPLNTLENLNRARAKRVQQLRHRATAKNRPLFEHFRRYLAHSSRQLQMLRVLFKRFFQDKASHRVRLKRFMTSFAKLHHSGLKLYRVLIEAVCGYVQSHGIRYGNVRIEPCLESGPFWVGRLNELKRKACACKQVTCAREQQRILNRYLRQVKVSEFSSSVAGQLEKAAREAYVCISKGLAKDK